MLTGQQVELWLFRIRLQSHYIISHLLILQVTVCCYFHFDTKDLQLYVLRPSPHSFFSHLQPVADFPCCALGFLCVCRSFRFYSLPLINLLRCSDHSVLSLCSSTSLLHSRSFKPSLLSHFELLRHSVSVMSCSPLVSLYIQ